MLLSHGPGKWEKFYSEKKGNVPEKKNRIENHDGS